MRLATLTPAVALLLGLAAVRAPQALASGDEEPYREQSEKSWNAAGLSGLEIDNPRGRVEVRRSSDGQIHMLALKIVRNSSHSRALELSGSTRVETATEGGRLVVRVHYPQRLSVTIGFWELFSGDARLPRVEVRIVAEVPASMPVSLSSTSGDLSIQDVAASEHVRSVSGDVSIRGARGPLQIGTTSGDLSLSDVGAVKLTTVSGDIEMEGVHGPARVHTTSGDVVANAADDSLAIETVSGDIKLERAPRGLDVSTTSGTVRVGDGAGRVRISTSSGDVELRLAAPLKGAQVSTNSGDVRVNIGGASCALELRTSSGELTVSLPVEIHRVDRHLVTAVVRGGGAPVILHSSSGDITVKGGGN